MKESVHFLNNGEKNEHIHESKSLIKAMTNEKLKPKRNLQNISENINLSKNELNNNQALFYFKLKLKNDEYFEITQGVLSEHIKYQDNKDIKTVKDQKIINEKVAYLLKNNKQWFKKVISLDPEGRFKVYIFSNFEKSFLEEPPKEAGPYEDFHLVSMNFFLNFNNKWERDGRTQNISIYQTYNNENVMDCRLDFLSSIFSNFSVIYLYVGIPTQSNAAAGLSFENKKFVWRDFKNTNWVQSSENEYNNFNAEVDELINVQEK